MNIISSLTLDRFHDICLCYLATRDNIYTLDKIHLGAIVSQHSESMQEIAHIPNARFDDSGWIAWLDGVQNTPTDMEDGWSRLHSSCVNGSITRYLSSATDSGCWLSQANYVFSQLPAQPKHEECLLNSVICYQLSFLCPPENLPEGFLLLCPLEDLRDDGGKWLSKPECPAYWSLDPSGSQRLSTEEASNVGFPSLNLETYVYSKSWDESVYAALSHFHAGKGFDPNSQDIARHLGYALYELSSRPNVDSTRSEYHCHVFCV
ncbi:hypothetical protein C8R44DRAFT_722868 [Mycena epipterygia]|nr:hypothetical protein C8R44DRAFT_722868 [Mycena epipterygia]